MNNESSQESEPVKPAPTQEGAERSERATSPQNNVLSVLTAKNELHALNGKSATIAPNSPTNKNTVTRIKIKI